MVSARTKAAIQAAKARGKISGFGDAARQAAKAARKSMKGSKGSKAVGRPSPLLITYSLIKDIIIHSNS